MLPPSFPVFPTDLVPQAMPRIPDDRNTFFSSMITLLEKGSSKLQIGLCGMALLPAETDMPFLSLSYRYLARVLRQHCD